MDKNDENEITDRYKISLNSFGVILSPVRLFLNDISLVRYIDKTGFDICKFACVLCNELTVVGAL